MDLEALQANYQPIAIDQPQSPQKKKKNFWLDQLSTAGGILGGIGGSFITPIAGTAAGAGAGSALGEAIENMITGDSVGKNVVKEGVLGAAFGAGPIKLAKGGVALATGKGVQAASQAAMTPLRQSLSGGVISKAGDEITDRATTSFLKLTPSQTKRLLDSGVDPVKLAQRASQFGGSAKEIIGETGNKGPLQSTIKALEDGIKQTAETAGTNIRISGDDLIKALKSHAKDMRTEIGGTARLKQINQVIKDAESKYAKGVTVRQARNILREANQKFGASVLDDAGDAVVRAAQKLEGNIMRDTLKSRFPSIAKALDDESELIQLREVLSRARAVDKTGKFNVGKFDLTRPGSFIDPILNSNQVSSKILRVGPKSSEAVKKPPTMRPGSLGIAGREIAQNILIPRQNPESLEDALIQSQSLPGKTNDITTATTSPMTNMSANASNINQLSQETSDPSSPFSPANVEANIQQILSSGGDIKDVADYLDIVKTMKDLNSPDSTKPLNQAQQERADLIKALGNTESVMAGGSINYGPVGSRIEGIKSMFNSADPETLSFKNSVSGLRAAITKARAGASLTEGELKMLAKYTPSDTDSEQVVRSKLAQLRSLYGYQAPTGGGSTLEDALMQYAQ